MRVSFARKQKIKTVRFVQLLVKVPKFVRGSQTVFVVIKKFVLPHKHTKRVILRFEKSALTKKYARILPYTKSGIVKLSLLLFRTKTKTPIICPQKFSHPYAKKKCSSVRGIALSESKLIAWTPQIPSLALYDRLALSFAHKFLFEIIGKHRWVLIKNTTFEFLVSLVTISFVCCSLARIKRVTARKIGIVTAFFGIAKFFTLIAPKTTLRNSSPLGIG